jgi:hypothetical protein
VAECLPAWVVALSAAAVFNGASLSAASAIDIGKRHAMTAYAAAKLGMFFMLTPVLVRADCG